MKHDPVRLNAPRRRSVRRAITETAEKRRWKILAQNVRTNHFHCVIDIGATKAKRALGALKANATRQMREDGCWRHEHSPWAEKGSCRNLWNDRSIFEACDYVLNGQGDELPDFDWW
ncbi:MAG: transposase [Acidobacteria bacterium]|nr:transposase [Acidobacteriota bacterium]